MWDSGLGGRTHTNAHPTGKSGEEGKSSSRCFGIRVMGVSLIVNEGRDFDAI
jgi:hypothetical protein